MNYGFIKTAASSLKLKVADVSFNTSIIKEATATQQNATGVYTGEPRTMIMVALTRRQAGLLRDFLRREDPEAFLTIVNSSEIIGKGFQSI